MLRSIVLVSAFGACVAFPALAGDATPPASAAQTPPVQAVSPAQTPSVQSSGDDVMAGYYGNTAIATGGMAEIHTIFSADHTFVMKAPAFGLEFKGTWAVNNGTLCRTFETPPPGTANPLCTPVEAHKVGDTWTSTNGSETRTIKLVEGVQ